MNNKDIFAIVLVLLLFYLLLKPDIVEGFWWLLENNVGTKQCLENKIITNTEIEIDGKTVSFSKVLFQLFNNISDDNCEITRNNLSERGFLDSHINIILNGNEVLTFDEFNRMVQISIEFYENLNSQDIVISNRARNNQPPWVISIIEEMNTNERGLFLGAICLIYNFLSLGRISIHKDEICSNLKVLSSINIIPETAMAFLPCYIIENMFEIFSNGEDTIQSFNSFINHGRILKTDVINFIDEENVRVDNEELSNMLKDQVEEIFRINGNGQEIIIDDFLEMILSEGEPQEGNILRQQSNMEVVLQEDNILRQQSNMASSITNEPRMVPSITNEPRIIPYSCNTNPTFSREEALNLQRPDIEGVSKWVCSQRIADENDERCKNTQINDTREMGGFPSVSGLNDDECICDQGREIRQHDSKPYLRRCI
tara:strand:+ start:1309 stop:2592 length:1284 start_codon:yes stop_codon:yes gene_type:complete